MATGITYTDNIIVGDFACDIQSIVRYRGGFVFDDKARKQYSFTAYEGCVFPPFTPVWVNHTTRTFWPILVAFANIYYPYDTATNQYEFGFLYNQSTYQSGVSATIIMKAREVSMTNLYNLKYTYATGSQSQFNIYKSILSTLSAREELIKYFPNFNFVVD